MPSSIETSGSIEGVLVPEFSRHDRFVRFKPRPVGDDVLAAQSARARAALALLKVNLLAVDGHDARAHGRDQLRRARPSPVRSNFPRPALVLLNVDQVHVRQVRPPRDVELVQQIRLQRLDRHDEERAEADGHDDDARLVARAGAGC